MALPVDTQTVSERPKRIPEESRKRYRRIAAAVVSGVFGKGTSLLVNAAIVPLTVRYLGSEGYGLWITISSAVAMFYVFDIGIANTLTNLISKAYAKDDQEAAAAYFATALWLVMGISGVLAAVGILLWPYMRWAFLFHVQSPALIGETPWAVAAALIVFLCALPTNLATKVFAGYQEVHRANLIAAGGSIASLLGVVLVTQLHGRLSTLIAVYAGAPAAANGLALIWICYFHKPWLRPRLSRFRTHLIGDIFHSGSQFFLIQIAGLVVLNTDNLIISHYLSPAQVTPYNVTWKMVSYITAAQILAVPALWPAYAEAYAKGDLAWIRSSYSRNRWISSAILALGCVVMLSMGKRIILFWAGAAAVPSTLLLRLVCVWMVIFAVTIVQSCLMGATNRVKKQAFFSIAGAGANLLFSILWVKKMGVPGVVLGTIASYLLFIVVPQTLEVRDILRGCTSSREG